MPSEEPGTQAKNEQIADLNLYIYHLMFTAKNHN